jgi:hypothetical protein
MVSCEVLYTVNPEMSFNLFKFYVSGRVLQLGEWARG